MIIGLVALLGVLIGAGVDYVADALLARRRIGGCPACPACGAARPALNWIAAVGYVTGRSHCPECKTGLSLRHLIVELGAAVVLIGIYLTRGLTPAFVLYALYACVFLVVLITDLEQHLIFNVVILPAIVIALAGSLLPGIPEPMDSIIGAAVGFGFFFIVALVKPGGMGAGDVKLAAFIGAVVGFPNIITALVIGIFSGGIVSLILVLTRVKTMKSYIAYGPFLLFGGAVIAFLGPLLARWARAA